MADAITTLQPLALLVQGTPIFSVLAQRYVAVPLPGLTVHPLSDRPHEPEAGQSTFARTPLYFVLVVPLNPRTTISLICAVLGFDVQ